MTKNRSLTTSREGLTTLSGVLVLVMAGLIFGVTVRSVPLIALFSACAISDFYILSTIARARAHRTDQDGRSGPVARPTAGESGRLPMHPPEGRAQQPSSPGIAPDHVVIAHCWPYRVFSTALMLLFVLVCLGSAAEEPAGPLSRAGLGGWLVSVPFALTAFRNAGARLRADAAGLRVRGLFRNRAIPQDRIARIGSVSYSGSLNWGGQSGVLNMPQVLLTDGRTIELPAFIGSSSSINALAARLNNVLHLVPSPAANPGRHRD